MKRIEKKRCLVFCIWIIVMGLVLDSRTVYASELPDELKECTGMVRFYYEGENEDYLVSEGAGVFVGEADGALSYIITDADTISLSEEETTSICETYSIEEEDRNKINTKIKVAINQNVVIDAKIISTSDNLGISILEINQPIYECKGAVFELDDELSVKAGEEVYTYNAVTNEFLKGVFYNTTSIDGISYIQHSINLTDGQVGSPLFNSKGELIGISSSMVDETHYYSLDRKEIVGFLSVLGIPYEVADHTVITLETVKLETAIAVIEKTDLSDYTEDSVAVVKSEMQTAKELLDNSEATQEDIDNEYTALLSAQESLVKDESLDTKDIVFIVVIAVLFVAICTFVVAIIVKKRKAAKAEKLRKEKESKKAPEKFTPFIAESAKYSVGPRYGEKKDATNNIAAMSVPSVSFEGFAPSSQRIRLNSEDTTILNAEDTQEQSKLFLIHAATNRKVEIDRNPFVIGKSQEKANFVINNSSISRSHMKIIQKEGEFYIQDLGSTNGTFIDEQRIDSSQLYVINSKSKIRVANEVLDIELVSMNATSHNGGKDE